ncbi:MAG: phosphoglycolate phosphatase [Hyphomicrobiaceae bacterium]|nr:phosphoglycolate phosphatase [Hyphomicrobiaceae bacterium]
MAEPWPQAVLFDLDGTLIDSAGDIADALNPVLARAGLAPFSDAEVRKMVGGGTRVLIERAMAARGTAADTELAQRLHADYMAAFRRASVARTLVHEHAGELLEQLRGQDVRLAVCTNKPQAITEDVLAKLGLGTSFQAVVGGLETRPLKPHPAMLEVALDLLGVTANQAVMVGDSGADVAAARAAGLPVVLVSFGYSRVPARELGADLVIETLAETIAAVEKLRLQRG